jgi:hypothetical protein
MNVLFSPVNMYVEENKWRSVAFASSNLCLIIPTISDMLHLASGKRQFVAECLVENATKHMNLSRIKNV